MRVSNFNMLYSYAFFLDVLLFCLIGKRKEKENNYQCIARFINLLGISIISHKIYFYILVVLNA